MDVEGMTGTGSRLYTPVRQNVVDRSQKRIEGIDTSAVRKQAEEEVRSNVTSK